MNKPWIILLALLMGITATTFPQATRLPAARQEFDKGEGFRKTSDFNAAAAAYRKAIEIDPDFTKAHEQFILTTVWAAARAVDSPSDPKQPKGNGDDNAKAERTKRIKTAVANARAGLTLQYQKWVKQHPEKAVFEWALGFINIENDPHAAEGYYLAALKLDPKFARAHQELAILEQDRGDREDAIEHLRQASEDDPADPEYLSNYAYTLKESNPAESQRLFWELVQRFPEDENASEALYYLAEGATNQQDKIHYLEILKAKYPPNKFDWSNDGMVNLFELYDQIAPQKALALTDEVSKELPQDEDWKAYSNYEHGMITAEQMLADTKPQAAVEVLTKLSLPLYAEHQRLYALRARAADANGETAQAYDDLIKIFAAKPTDELRDAVVMYGHKLGKDPKQMDDDILKVRETDAKPIIAFSLQGYGSSAPISLADFKGHVILLNFWFPECGPCHGEFPYIKNVLEKYKDQGFAIIAVNVAPAQDDLVLPLLEGYKLGFIPAKTDEKIEIAYGVRGEPTNFLLGPDGRVWFKPGSISDAKKQRTLELQIEALLRLKGTVR